MLKKLILSVVLLLALFLNTQIASAQIKGIPFTPPPKNLPQYVPNQLIIVFKEGESPDQLKKQVSEIKTQTSSLLGRLGYQIKVVTGQAKPLSFYEEKIEKIDTTLKNTGVVKTQSVTNVWGTTTSKATFKNDTNLQNAIKKIKKLPEVQNVDYNYYRYTSKISSEDSDTVPNKFVIQYKDGSTPPELEQKVEQRQSISSSTLGQARIAAEDLGNALTKEAPPEVKLDRIEAVAEDVGRINEKPLVNNSSSAPETLKNTFVVTTNGSESTTETLVKYSSLPEVENIRVVNKIYPLKTPNDPDYSKMWSLPLIKAPAAWDKSTGSDGVTVSVIDTGIDYNHQDLSGHVIKGPDYFNNDTDPMDDGCGHGTHVAGTIGALTNNSIGVAGINWNVKLLAVKTMGPAAGGECGGDDSVIAQAITYSADHGAKVINMSLGGYSSCPFDMQQAINYARGKGTTIVVAAGNESTDAASSSPANCNGVITVGAVGPSDTRASYSNFGTVVSISAPGGQPAGSGCSASNCISSTFPNNQYAAMAGTSMAAPHVAGAAALVLSVNSSLSPDEVKNILVSNADPIQTDRNIGPRLNLEKAVNAVSGGNPPASPTPTTGGGGITPTPSVNLTNCTVSDSELAINSEEEKMITLVNNYRKEKGLNELKPSINLTRAAAWMANDQSGQSGLSHKDSLGRLPDTRFPDCGYQSSIMGENIEKGSSTAQEAFDGFKNSPEHNANMLESKYTAVGIGRVGNTWVQTFGGKEESGPPSGNITPSPSAGPTPTGTISPSPSGNEGNWNTSIEVKIPGIGKGAGDNSNPKNKELDVDLEFIGSDGQVKADFADVLDYSNEKGLYSGKWENAYIGGTNFPPPAGFYRVRIKTPNTLSKLIPGFYEVKNSPSKNNLIFPQIALTSGDINEDSVLDVLDYNILLSCIIQGRCQNQAADLNFDGLINPADLNIFLRQLDERHGE